MDRIEPLSVGKTREEPQPGGVRTQATLSDARLSAFEKYRRLVVGPGSLGYLLLYEIITGLFGQMPGMIGLFLRRYFYRFLFDRMGRGVVIGRNVTLRHPARIRIGNNVFLEDEVVLDAKGGTGIAITIRDGVFIGRGTIISARSGTIEIGEGSSISSYCRIGRSKIGRKVLIAAYVYLVSGGHRSDRLDVPVMDQPIESLGGVEIGDGCWIGARASLMDGIRVGQDAIIGAHSLVTFNIPPFAIAYGAPARVQRDRRNQP